RFGNMEEGCMTIPASLAGKEEVVLGSCPVRRGVSEGAMSIKPSGGRGREGIELESDERCRWGGGRGERGSGPKEAGPGDEGLTDGLLRGEASGSDVGVLFGEEAVVGMAATGALGRRPMVTTSFLTKGLVVCAGTGGGGGAVLRLAVPSVAG